MLVHFSKYHGTGNDFVMIDGRELKTSPFDAGHIRQLCDRRFGIGADGLIILEKSKLLDFTKRYYNADGLDHVRKWRTLHYRFCQKPGDN